MFLILQCIFLLILYFIFSNICDVTTWEDLSSSHSSFCLNRERDVFWFSGKFHTINVFNNLNEMCFSLIVKDRPAWTKTKNETYSVKSGHHFWTLSTPITRMLWTLLYGSWFGHKIFIQRFCRNTIPVRKRLATKGISIPRYLSDVWNRQRAFT